MSRIGKQPIALASGIKATVDGSVVFVEGPKGKLTQKLPGGIRAEMVEQELVLQRKDDSKAQKSLHGTARSLVANAVHGVGQGFSKALEIHGVGFGAEVKGRVIHFKLGYSHPVEFPIPEGIEVTVVRNAMTVSGCDRQKVGQVAANIRDLKRPDVYKLKGIRYAGEQLRKKAGKAGVK